MKKIGLLACGVLFSSWVNAAVSVPNIEQAKKNIQASIPVPFDNVQATPLKNIFSGENQGRVVYFDDQGQYLFVGDLIRLSDGKNLTQEQILQSQRIDWDSLPFNQAIKTIKGNGSREIAVFSDPNCPYCQKFEQELEKLNDVTIYTFIYALKPASVELSKQVWCEANPAQAWQNLLTKNIRPKAKANCENPIETNLKLGRELKITGTPAIIFSNGYRQLGAVPAAQLEQMLKEVE